MKRKQILLTFDYELFLGKNSGSVSKCMLEPTNKIQLVLAKHKVQAIFFIDTTYLFRLEEMAKEHPKASSDFDKIILQLKSLAVDGHYLYHHLHPNWLDAKYHEDTNLWNCSNHSRFTLSHLDIDEITRIVTYSDTLLRSLYPSNKCPEFLGFRAGGLYSQPFDRLIPLFKEKKIKYDFSVLKGAFSMQFNYSFDYRNVSDVNKIIYNFNTNNTIEDSDGFFTEFAMDDFNMNIFQRIINSVYYRLNFKKKSWLKFGDGDSSGNIISNDFKLINVKESYSIELMNSIKLYLYLNKFNKLNCIHFISHPKLTSINSIKSFDKFLNNSKKKYILVSELKKIIEISS